MEVVRRIDDSRRAKVGRQTPQPPAPIFFPPVTSSEETTGLGEPQEEKCGVSCKLLKETK